MAKMSIPKQVMKYIGYIINIVEQQLEVPADKLIKTRNVGKVIVEHFKRKKQIKVQVLQSFCGLVRYLSPIFFYLVPCLRSLEEAIGSHDKNDKIWVTKEMVLDIEAVIRTIMQSSRNRISFKWLLYPKDKGDIITETDAS